MKIFAKEFFKSFSLFSAKALFVFILVIISAGVIGNIAVNNTQKVTEPRTFNIDGDSKREITPDRGIIVIGTFLEGKDIKTIQKDGNDKIDKAIKEIKDLGVNSENIKTSSYELNPSYNYTNNVNRIDGYTLNIELTVKVDGINESTEKIEKVVGIAISNGLEEIRSLRYEVIDQEAIIEELKLEAIENAKTKVEGIEKSTGIKLGKIVSVNFGGYFYPYYNEYYDGAVSMDSVKSNIDETQSVTIEPGQNELNATVTIVYEVL